MPVRKFMVIGLSLTAPAQFFLAHSACAQVIDNYFPAIGSGAGDLEQEPAQIRANEAYAPLGKRFGPLRIDADAAEGEGYNSNVDRLVGGHSSAVVSTQANLSAVARWGQRDQVHGAIGVDDTRYPSRGIQNRTNWTANLGGVHDFGHDTIGAAYTHLSLVQTPTDLGALVMSRPVPYQVDDIRASYTATTHGRLSFIPQGGIQRYHFDYFTPSALQPTQSYRDRVLISQGVTAQYELRQDSHILLVLQGTEIRYQNRIDNAPSRDSNGAAILAGYDFGQRGPVRFRALVGYQTRRYRAGAYSVINSPIAEGELTWLPTRLTTVSASVRHGIEDSAFENVVGYTFTGARIGVRHAYQRNIIFSAYGQIQKANYPAAPSFLENTTLYQARNNQTFYGVGAGAEWRINRHISLSANYDFSSQNTVGSGSFPVNAVMVRLHLAL
ncbi:MAG: outer membrane beta-barrel protein [Acetobacter sp.]|uniref:outer membrane beta-barrel protein n=1 Tax=Acetobacter sp. TaxID=440 RepID=UPI0039ED8504